MLRKPDLLVITDDDIAYGVEKGYYPDLTKAVINGNLIVIGYEGWQKNSEIKIKGKPLCNGEDVFILNPYSNYYIKASDNEILDVLCEDKSCVVKEALVKMGAKHIVIYDEVADKDTLNIGSKVDVSSIDNAAGGSLNTSFSRIQSMNIKNRIESHDDNRMAKTYQEVEEYINNHGLYEDIKLKTLCERLKSDGKLSGTEYYELTYLNEINSALKILMSVNYKVFNGSLDFSLEHNHIHQIIKKLTIKF